MSQTDRPQYGLTPGKLAVAIDVLETLRDEVADHDEQELLNQSQYTLQMLAEELGIKLDFTPAHARKTIGIPFSDICLGTDAMFYEQSGYDVTHSEWTEDGMNVTFEDPALEGR